MPQRVPRDFQDIFEHPPALAPGPRLSISSSPFTTTSNHPLLRAWITGSGGHPPQAQTSPYCAARHGTTNQTARAEKSEASQHVTFRSRSTNQSLAWSWPSRLFRCAWKTQTKLGLGTSLASPVKESFPVTLSNLRATRETGPGELGACGMQGLPRRVRGLHRAFPGITRNFPANYQNVVGRDRGWASPLA